MDITPTGPALIAWTVVQVGTLFVLWMRARNDSRNARVSQIETLSNALNAALGSLDVMRRRQDETEQARTAERLAANEERIRLENALDALKDEQARLCELIDSQAAELARLKDENARLQERVLKIEMERDALRHERDALSRERDALRKETVALQQESVALKERVAELEREVETLKKKGTGPLGEPPVTAGTSEPGEVPPGGGGKVEPSADEQETQP